MSDDPSSVDTRQLLTSATYDLSSLEIAVGQMHDRLNAVRSTISEVKRRHVADLARQAELPSEEEIEQAGLNAELPEDFQWGADAMEQFDFGKKRAVLAILALLRGRP